MSLIGSIGRQFALALVLVGSVGAAASVWLDFAGNIPGDSTHRSHLEWIDVESFEISGMLSNIGGFSVIKSTDKASPLLFRACAIGTEYPSATLDLQISGAETTARDLLRIELGGVMVTSQQSSLSPASGNSTETVALKFRTITYTYFLADRREEVFQFDNLEAQAIDSDDDQMPDAWERDNGLNVGINDSGLDLDGDGLTNLEELMLGTNPGSGASFFKAVLTPKAENEGAFELSWSSVAGKSYLVEWSADPAIPFTTIRTITAAGATTVIDVTKSSSVGFYRVRPAP